MSYDLFVFYSREPLTDEAAAEQMNHFTGLSLDMDGVPGKRLAAFLDDFLPTARQIENVPAGDLLPPYEIEIRADAALIHLPFRTPEAVIGEILDLAGRHSLAVFDPQVGVLISGAYPPDWQERGNGGDER